MIQSQVILKGSKPFRLSAKKLLEKHAKYTEQLPMFIKYRFISMLGKGPGLLAITTLEKSWARWPVFICQFRKHLNAEYSSWVCRRKHSRALHMGHQKSFTEMKHLRDPKCPHKLVPDLPACRCALRKTLGLTEGQAWREGHVFQNSNSNLITSEGRKASTYGYS